MEHGSWYGLGQLLNWLGLNNYATSQLWVCTLHSVPLKMCTSPNVHQICTSPLKSLQVCTSPSVYLNPNLYLFKCVLLQVCTSPSLQVCTTCSLILTARSTSAASSIRYRCHQSHHYHPCWRQFFILMMMLMMLVLMTMMMRVMMTKMMMKTMTMRVTKERKTADVWHGHVLLLVPIVAEVFHSFTECVRSKVALGAWPRATSLSLFHSFTEQVQC